MTTQRKNDAADKGTKEKRKSPRYACFETTFYSTEKGVYEGVIKNKDKDTKGIFILTNEKLRVGEVITVAIPASDKNKGLKLRGEIVRKQPDGFGVHFKRYLNE